MNSDLRRIERADWLYHCRKLIADQADVVKGWQQLADDRPDLPAYAEQLQLERHYLQQYKQQYEEAKRGTN